MKFVFRNDTVFNRIEVLVSDTWMCQIRGEGEEEIANHGRSRVKSFSQETGAIGQHAPRIGEHEPKLHSQSQAQDVHDSPTQLPFFSLLSTADIATCEVSEGLQQPFASDSPRASLSFLALLDFRFLFSEYCCTSFLALRNLRRAAATLHLPLTTKFVVEAKKGLSGIQALGLTLKVFTSERFDIWPSAKRYQLPFSCSLISNFRFFSSQFFLGSLV